MGTIHIDHASAEQWQSANFRGLARIQIQTALRETREAAECLPLDNPIRAKLVQAHDSLAVAYGLTLRFDYTDGCTE